MHRIEASGFLFREAHGLDGNDFKTSFMDAGENFPLKVTTDRIRFDDCESAFNCHERILPKNRAGSPAKARPLQNQKTPIEGGFGDLHRLKPVLAKPISKRWRRWSRAPREFPPCGCLLLPSRRIYPSPCLGLR